jgi:hypothetical protein
VKVVLTGRGALFDGLARISVANGICRGVVGVIGEKQAFCLGRE